MSSRHEHEEHDDDGDGHAADAHATGAVACTDVSRHYSSLLESSPLESSLADADAPGGVPAAVRAHVAACDACRRDFDGFARAVRDLRSLAVPRASDILVADILAAVDAEGAVPAGDLEQAQRPARPRRGAALRVASHLSCAAAGALIVLLAFEREDAPTETAPAAILSAVAPATGVRMSFEDGAGHIRRAGQLERVFGSVTFYPGEHVQVLSPAPRIREPATLEPLPDRVPDALLAHERDAPIDLHQIDFEEYTVAISTSLDRMWRSFDHVARTWDRVALPAISSTLRTRTDLARIAPRPDPDTTLVSTHPDERPAAGDAGALRAPAPVAQPRRDAGVTATREARPGTPALTARAPAPAGAALPSAPVVVRRGDGQVRLETRGPITEVVPGLLELLHDPDRDLARLVLERLALLREQLEQDAALRDRFAASDQSLARRLEATHRESMFSRMLPRSEQPVAPPAPAVVWTHWWESNAVHLLARGADGTF